MRKYCILLLVLVAGVTLGDSVFIGAGGLSDAPSDGTQYARKDAGWEAVVAGGSGAIYYSFPASNESNELGDGPPVVGQLDGYGNLVNVFESDGASNIIERLDPVVHWVPAGTYSAYAVASVYVTNAAYTCTNVQLNVYVYAGASKDGTADFTSASVTDISALTIDTAITNQLSATGTVVVATDSYLGVDLHPWAPLGADGAMRWYMGEMTLTPQ